MAIKTIKASVLIGNFRQMQNEKWQYVSNGNEYGAVDCSGAFYYWYRKAGSYMYHGSNTMWREYTTQRGDIGTIELVPGMALFRRKPWTPADDGHRYYGDKEQNVHHVGLYVGNGKCIEAKGTNYGIVESCISSWDMAARLKYTDYDVAAESAPPTSEDNTEVGMRIDAYVSTTNGGKLNLRKKPTTDSVVLATIPNGEQLVLTNKTDGWYETRYKGLRGWVSGQYITFADTVEPSCPPNDSGYDYERTFIVTVRNSRDYEELDSYLRDKDMEYYIENGDD